MYAHKNKRRNEWTATPDKFPQKRFNPKPCRKCATVFQPVAPSNLYCSDPCADHGLASAYLKRTYGISLDDYHLMLEEQGHRCKLCGGEGFVMNAAHHKLKLVVDHCHGTGKIRGLLCHNCNRALGLLQDDVETLRKAIEYLKV